MNWSTTLKWLTLKFSYNRHIVIIGLTPTGFAIAENLLDNGKKVIVLSKNTDGTMADRIKKKGGLFLDREVIGLPELEFAVIHKASKCILTLNDDMNISLLDFISQLKANGGKQHLEISIHLENRNYKNLLIDHITKFHNSHNLSISIFNLNQEVSRYIYDKYSPHNYVQDDTATNVRKTIAIIGFNETAEFFLIENMILSHAGDKEFLKVVLITTQAVKLHKELIKKYPFLEQYLVIEPIEMENNSFTSVGLWEESLCKNIPSIDVAYCFGDDDAEIMSRAIHFKQFYYKEIGNIRKVPVVACLIEDTQLLALLEKGEKQGGDSLIKNFETDLLIYSVRKYSDVANSGVLRDNSSIETLAKAINYYYSIQYQFDYLLNKEFKKKNNFQFLQNLAEHYLEFKIKKSEPLKQLEAFVLGALEKYTKNSGYRVKEYFGIEERWNAISERDKESNRYAARHIPVKLSLMKELNITSKESIRANFKQLAPLEHFRWSAEKQAADFVYSSLPDADQKLKSLLKSTLKIHNHLVSYESLSEDLQKKDLDSYYLVSLLNKVKSAI